MMSGYDKAARELLTFYVEAGVDAALGEEPVDRFADPGSAFAEPVQSADALQSARDRRPAPAAPTAPAAPAVTLHAPPPPEEAIAAAREAARSAADLASLKAIMTGFEGCALRNTARQLVFGDGSHEARLMFVGEAPGSEEDQQGIPFVGRSGQLLDRMLAAIGMTRAEAYIANIVPWRPPGNRDPSTHETQICLPFIQRQIELVDPDVMVCLGKPATVTLLGVTEGIRRARGRWFPYQTGTREIRAIATYHPDYLLRTPIEKRLAWRDFLAIKKALKEKPDV